MAQTKITGDVIADGTITAAKLASGAAAAANGSISTEKLADDAVTTDKLANSINSAITANTAKVTNATHTGDVTGGTALTIAVDAVDIPMLSASGSPSSTTFLRGDNAWASPGGVDVQSSAPSVAAEGSLYYNTTSNLLFASDGTAWVAVGNFAPGTTGGTVTIPSQAGRTTFTYNLGINFTDADTPDGSLAYTLASGTLPAGAVLPSSGNSALTGTATNPGSNTTYNFVIKATDSGGASSTQAYTQVITPGVLSIEYVMVAGGGGGAKGQNGDYSCGGGGAGGHVTGTANITGGGKSIVVGAGGAAGQNGGYASTRANGVSGVSSTIAGYNTASVGGGHGTAANYTLGGSHASYNGGAGGSGGAGAYTGTGGAGTSGQGNAGGGNSSGSPYRGAGGGGAGGVGANGGGATGAGGAGINTYSAWATASSTGDGGFYCGGGGGAGYTDSTSPSPGGSGGGGNGSGNSGNATPGDANTGGGGGGAQGPGNRSAGAGGSGVVIIKYSGGTAASGGTITASGGYTYHTFTSSGTFTPS